METLEGRVKFSIAAKMLGFSYRHAQRLAYDNKIPTIITDSGHKFVPISWIKTQTEIKDPPENIMENLIKIITTETIKIFGKKIGNKKIKKIIKILKNNS